MTTHPIERTTMNRSKLALLTAAALATFGLTACNDSGQSYDTICVNPYTQFRIPDAGCPGAWLYYVPYGYYAPAYGHRVSHFNRSSYTRPKSATVHTGGVPTTGGKASAPVRRSTGGVNLRKQPSVSRPKPAAPRPVRIGKR